MANSAAVGSESSSHSAPYVLSPLCCCFARFEPKHIVEGLASHNASAHIRAPVGRSPAPPASPTRPSREPDGAVDFLWVVHRWGARCEVSIQYRCVARDGPQVRRRSCGSWRAAPYLVGWFWRARGFLVGS